MIGRSVRAKPLGECIREVGQTMHVGDVLATAV
jgi:hypothetical protein